MMRYVYTTLAILQFGWMNLRRNRVTTWVSSSIIMAVLWMIGSWLQVHHWVRAWIMPYRSSLVMYVYLTTDITPEQHRDLERFLHHSPLVADWTFLDADAARQRFTELFPEMAPIIRSLEVHPIPPHYEVRLHPRRVTPQDADALADTLRRMAGVLDVDYERWWVERLTHIYRIVQWGGMVLASILTVMGLFTVANVIRLSFFARREEVQILRLLGAHPWHVRLPFYIEGILLGCVGSVFAVVLWWVGFHGIVWYVRRFLQRFWVVNPQLMLYPGIPLWMTGIGLCLGLLGAILALWMMRLEEEHR